MHNYRIYTDSVSTEVSAQNVADALSRLGGVPSWVKNEGTFETWLSEVGGYGGIEEDGVIIARVKA